MNHFVFYFCIVLIVLYLTVAEFLVDYIDTEIHVLGKSFTGYSKPGLILGWGVTVLSALACQ